LTRENWQNVGVFPSLGFAARFAREPQLEIRFRTFALGMVAMCGLNGDQPNWKLGGRLTAEVFDKRNGPLDTGRERKTQNMQANSNPPQSESQRFRHRNEVHIAGVLAKEPEIRYTTAGKTVSNFTVATTYEKRTEYHRIVAWENQAERLKRFHKDDFIKLAGRLQTRSYEKEGKKNWITEIIVWSLSDGTTATNGHGLGVSDEDIPF
jgi:hypothetical protein